MPIINYNHFGHLNDVSKSICDIHNNYIECEFKLNIGIPLIEYSNDKYGIFNFKLTPDGFEVNEQFKGKFNVEDPHNKYWGMELCTGFNFFYITKIIPVERKVINNILYVKSIFKPSNDNEWHVLIKMMKCVYDAIEKFKNNDPETCIWLDIYTNESSDMMREILESGKLYIDII